MLNALKVCNQNKQLINDFHGKTLGRQKLTILINVII